MHCLLIHEHLSALLLGCVTVTFQIKNRYPQSWVMTFVLGVWAAVLCLCGAQ